MKKRREKKKSNQIAKKKIHRRIARHFHFSRTPTCRAICCRFMIRGVVVVAVVAVVVVVAAATADRSFLCRCKCSSTLYWIFMEHIVCVCAFVCVNCAEFRLKFDSCALKNDYEVSMLFSFQWIKKNRKKNKQIKPRES